jgi:hypothetical protein
LTNTTDFTYDFWADLSDNPIAHAVRGFVWYYTSAAAGFKFMIETYYTGSFSGVMSYRYQEPGGAVTYVRHTSEPFDTIVLSGGFARSGWIRFDGTAISLSPTDRALRFSWTQAVADASNTTLKAGSYIEWEPMP